MTNSNVYLVSSSEDRDWATQFGNQLSRMGFVVHPRAPRILHESEWAAETERSLREADYIVTVLTPENADNPNVFFMLGVAVASGKPLVPVVPPEVTKSQLPVPLRTRRSVTKLDPGATAAQVADYLRHLDHA